MHIVCVHQGYELYGSDRAFIDSVAALREAWPQADIEVVLPHDGPDLRAAPGIRNAYRHRASVHPAPSRTREADRDGTVPHRAGALACRTPHAFG
jgi:hypothetical protein